MMSGYKAARNAPKQPKGARLKSSGGRGAQLEESILRVYLVHVPKTAGTAIKHILNEVRQTTFGCLSSSQTGNLAD
jgi:hypothetical protein